MKYYLDITLLPDAEVSLGFIWEKVYQQLHLMLAENKVGQKDAEVGFTFPQYGSKEFALGAKLRIFAQSQQQLAELNIDKWLSRLTDYVHIRKVQAVPSDIKGYAFFKRRQFKSPDKLRANVDKRAKVIAKKNGFDLNETKIKLLENIDKQDTRCTLPFVYLQSLSSDSKQVEDKQLYKFRLFIEQQLTDKSSDNQFKFTCYGLSRRESDKQVALPLF